MAQKNGFIVRRLSVDGHASGHDRFDYIKVARPNPGELIFHGEFVSRRVEIADNGPNGSVYKTVYIPIDELKLTHERYDGGSEVEIF